jgi:uncharacterized protein (DUF433 family)
MNLPEWITRDPDGHLHITGHRISMENVVFFFNQGDTPEMLHLRFPSVSVPKFYKAIAFYLENQPEVDAYCAESARMVEEHRAAMAGRGPTIEELRRRWEAKKAAGWLPGNSELTSCMTNKSNTASS